jgi:transposase
LTQQSLWEEHRRINPDGYRYSRFCELYQRWRRKQDVVLRQEHKAGEKLFVDCKPLGCLNAFSRTSRTASYAGEAR